MEGQVSFAPSQMSQTSCGTDVHGYHLLALGHSTIKGKSSSLVFLGLKSSTCVKWETVSEVTIRASICALVA